jgi:hypothetical protein
MRGFDRLLRELASAEERLLLERNAEEASGSSMRPKGKGPIWRLLDEQLTAVRSRIGTFRELKAQNKCA